ncbi:MAG: hypothetical protein ACI3X3_07225 [Acidaminococcus sp.]|uniref:hypothetical protein n=1 Tax=Acidaminococcus sp. TaxID=1872103 RepID=UPI003F16964F
MGGRGASTGISIFGKVYGTEYKSIYRKENIKFLVQNSKEAVKTPMETRTRGRVYVMLGRKSNNPVSITYYDGKNRRMKQIDLTHYHNGKKPHVHIGYVHDENGNRGLTIKEKRFVRHILKIWYNEYRSDVVQA